MGHIEFLVKDKRFWEKHDCSLERDEAGFFVFDTCKQFSETVPAIPRDQRDMDDVDTDCEDHIADECW